MRSKIEYKAIKKKIKNGVFLIVGHKKLLLNPKRKQLPLRSCKRVGNRLTTGCRPNPPPFLYVKRRQVKNHLNEQGNHPPLPNWDRRAM
jgi:hypothetical protein